MIEVTADTTSRFPGWFLPARPGGFSRKLSRLPARERLDVVDADPDDNRVLECAVAAGSRFIVTSDGDLLRLGAYAGIRILKVADFLELIREPPA